MLVLASYKRLRGGELSRQLTLTRDRVLDENARDETLALLRELLAARGDRAALSIVSRIPFQFIEAFNDDHEESFYVLHASTNVAAYEHLRQLFAADSEPFETLRQTLTNDCDIYVGFVVAELAAKGSEANPSSTVALEQAIAEMKKLMIAIGRRELSVKDKQTSEDYARLRKELLKYRTIAPPPPLVADCPDEWTFWGQLSKAETTYAGRSAMISEQFEAAYANVLAGEVRIDLSTFFSSRGLLLGGEIGQGGFGVVYRAKHSLLGDRAIKIFQPRFFESDSTALLRFTREASLLERVAHPRIVRFFDAGVAPTGTPFLVTAFVEGRSVDRMLREDGVIALEEAIDLMHQVLEGLAAAHAQGIAHRDIKPSNVMWHQGVATILDLGSAGFVDDFVTTRLTRTAQGTPGYLAPEQIENPLVVDVRSDFFAAGQMFHQMLTGKLVQPANLGHYLSGLPNGGSIHAFLLRAMAPLDHRYADAVAMDAALLALSTKKLAGAASSDLQATPASSFLVEEADIRSVLGLDTRWSVSDLWLQWAHAQLTAPSGSRSIVVRLVRIAATWLDANGREWIDRDELLTLGQVVFGLLENIATEELTAETQRALAEGVAKGWLREEEYDDWRPGMASGTGMRDHYKLTPLGKKIIADAGYQSLPAGAAPKLEY